MNHEAETYTATYVFSAEQQEDVMRIYRKYQTPQEGKRVLSSEEEKIARLHKLDKSVGLCGGAAAVGVSALGALLHGAGIRLIQGGVLLILGAVIAAAGLALVISAYPVYGYAAKKQRKRVEPEILKLCQELMK